MAQDLLSIMDLSPYTGACFVLTTKHHKSLAVAPAFERILKASVIEYVVDTDLLGTFSGEVERVGSALECARKKCELGVKSAGADFALSSEGSFGRHPMAPFLPADKEILYFIDNRKRFSLHESIFSTDTNYKMTSVTFFDDAMLFAEQALFPSHALIVRPSRLEENGAIFKGIQNKADLQEAFIQCRKQSAEDGVWIETDMRANFNPTRMKTIEHLAEKMAKRLSSLCPRCEAPGWGMVGSKPGLPCEGCGMPTHEVKSDVYCCAKCGYKELHNFPKGKSKASMAQCAYCNP